MIERKEIDGTLVCVRPPEPGDINFMLSTMLRGLFFGSKFWGEVDQDSFFKYYEPFLKTLMLKSDIRVACLDDDQDVILGWSMYSGSVMHFVFVKKSYRKKGIAKMLCPSGIDTVSHITDSGNSIRKRLDFKFNPFAV
jgi:hypothetical protein